MKQKILFILVFAFLIQSCNFSPYPDYRRVGNGVYMSLIELGDGPDFKEGTFYISMNVSYSQLNDSIFFMAVRKFRFDRDERKDEFSVGLTGLQEGDSASFIVDTEDFFNTTLNREVPDYLLKDDRIRVDLRILSVQAEKEYIREKELFLEWFREFSSSEDAIISSYLQTYELDIEPEPEGIYFLSRQKGSGTPVQTGKQVWVHYEGRFLNGKFVDSSRHLNRPLDYTYGQEMILIDGLNAAVGKMREGGKAVVLIPSEFGFGAKGSAACIVPPYTSMIYELEIIRVE